MAGGLVASWRRWVALLCLALVVASCGARWSDDERAAVLARHTADAEPTTPADQEALQDGGALASGGAVELLPDDAGPTPSGGSGPSPADPSPAGGLAALPCAAPSTAPGVTDRVLTVGNMATVSGPVPGLGATAQEAARSYVAYVNSRGGVCGREVRLLTADDGNEGSRSRQIVTDFAPKILGIIGLFAPSAGAAAEIMEREKLPVIGSVGDQQVRAVSTVFNLNPPAPATGVKKYDHLKSEGVRTVAVVTLSAAAAVEELNTHQAQMEGAGIRVVSRQILPVTTLSFDSAARVVANSKADYLFFLGAENMDASMAQSMRATGYRLKFEEYLTGYGSKFPQIAGSAAEGTSSWIRSVPVEEAASHAELRTFLEWMRRTSPGTSPDVFAVDAWAASKAFFDSLEALRGPISRAALVAQLRTLTSYDADGLVGRIDLANGRSNGCLIGMRREGGTWRRIAPATGFLC